MGRCALAARLTVSLIKERLYMSVTNNFSGPATVSGPATISLVSGAPSYANSLTYAFGSSGSFGCTYLNAAAGYLGAPEFLFGSVDYSPLRNALNNDINTVYHITGVIAWGPYDYTALNGTTFKFASSPYLVYGVFELNPSGSFVSAASSLSGGDPLWIAAQGLTINWN